MSKLDSPKREANEMTLEKLGNFLRAHNVPLENWGTGNAKTVNHLLSEVNSGESKLSVIDGQVVREVTSIVMNIYYQQGANTWRLIEEKQVFADGHTRVRNDWISMGEKMIPNENPEAALHRALQEELHIEGLQSVIEQPTIVEDKPSETFPGILSKHRRYHFDVVLQEKDFKPDGYMEVQPDKITYFTWRKVDALPDVN